MRNPTKTLLLLTGLLLTANPEARAVVGAGTTITFSELPAGPVNGLSVGGVTFGFTINGLASSDAIFGATAGPGPTPFNSPPHLEGNTLGLLMLDFASPIVFLQFGSHLSVETNVTAALGVQFYDSSMMPLGSVLSLDMTRSPNFAGGRFEYDGPEARHAAIQFNKLVATRFTIDTLTFVPVPEPMLAWLIVPALAGGIYLRRRSASRA